MEAKEVIEVLKACGLIQTQQEQTTAAAAAAKTHPMLGKRCIIRTYSAGVHIGTVAYVNPSNSMEVKLTDALRLWRWENGGLSLSAIANNGVKGGRLNKTGEVYLTNAIEYIPTTEQAEKSFVKFLEDVEE